MVFLRHTLEALLNPFFIGLLVIMLVLLALKQQWRYAPQRNLLMFVLGLFLIISTGWLPAHMTYFLEHQFKPVRHPDTAVRWIVVLSGGQADSQTATVTDRLYGASIRRLLEGMRLHQQLPEASLLLSGGGVTSQSSEAKAMAQLALRLGFPEKHMVIEAASVNTSEQISAIASQVQNAPFYLVTSAIHMPRVMAICRQKGLQAMAAPTDFTHYWQDERWQKTWIPNAQNMVYFNRAFHELLGRIWAVITSMI